MNKNIGFSTGAIAKGDFMSAIQILPKSVRTIELSALREEELEPLLDYFSVNRDALHKRFDHISVHAPSRFTYMMSDSDGYEKEIVNKLLAFECPIIVHPDAIRNNRIWNRMGPVLWLENTDTRKPVGQTYYQMKDLFRYLPDANFCLDLGHARQVDSTMEEAKAMLLRDLRPRLRQIHISEVNHKSEHLNMDNMKVVQDFVQVTPFIPETVPVIIESPCPTLADINTELNAMHLLFPSRMEEYTLADTRRWMVD